MSNPASRARIVLQAQDTTAPAFNSLKQRLGAAKGEIDGLARGFGSFAAGFTGLLGGLGIAAFVRSTVDGVAKLKTLKDATGASIENLSALEDIARRTGTGMDDAGRAVVKFNQALNAAKPRSAQAQAIEAIGLSVKELERLDPAEGFRRMAVALAGFADDGRRARIEQVLFGEEIKILAPLLRNLGEVGEYNATMTTQQALAAEQFNNQLASLEKNATDASRAIVFEVLPALNRYMETLSRLPQNARILGAANVAAFETETLSVAVGRVQRLHEALNRNPGNDRLAQQLADARRETDSLLASALRTGAALKDLLPPPAIGAGGGRGFVYPAFAKPVLPEAPTTTTKRPAGPARADPIQALIDSTTAARTEKLIGLRQKLDAQFAAGKRSAVDYARGIEAIDAALLALQPKTVAATDALGEFIEKIGSARAAEVAGIVSQSTGARYEALALQAQLLSESFEQGAISVVDFTRGAEVLGAQFEALAPRVEQVTEQVNAFAQQAARNIQDSLGSTLLSVLDGNFKTIGDMWANTIKRMVAEAAAAQLGQHLFGAAFASTGVLGGALGGMFGGARATGGPVQPGRAYLVGEKGPELMVPRQAGTVVPNGAAVSGGGGPVFAPVLHVNGDVSPQTIAAMRAEIGRWHARYMRQLSVAGAA